MVIIFIGRDFGATEALMPILRLILHGTLATGILTLVACAAGDEASGGAETARAARDCDAVNERPARIPGGTFLMGQAGIYGEEGPVRPTRVDGLWIDRHEVTNRQFAEFVRATGHVTVAERPVDPAAFGVPEDQIPPHLLLPGSAVFTPPARPSTNYADWWIYLPGASWKRPFGPDGRAARPAEPVVHLGWADMAAYAAWKGGRLPTEAEWEYAAAAGAPPSREQPGPQAANSWEGVFPMVNSEADGFAGLAPVGCFTPNAFGLYDMIGNVWEVTADFYRPVHDPADTDNPRGPSENAAYDPYNPAGSSRVMKGGSYLCAPNYCQRYRPAARQGRDPGMGTSNVGFRLAYDEAPG